MARTSCGSSVLNTTAVNSMKNFCCSNCTSASIRPKVKTFWPPERVWDTRRMAPVLRDARLRNGGYQYVILDDRLLLAQNDERQSRATYDETNHFDPDLYTMHEIKDGLGLVTFPIATRLRRSIPPGKDDDWTQVQSELEALLVHATGAEEQLPLLAVYADDMEKVAGVGEWGGGGPERYREFPRMAQPKVSGSRLCGSANTRVRWTSRRNGQSNLERFKNSQRTSTRVKATSDGILRRIGLRIVGSSVGPNLA